MNFKDILNRKKRETKKKESNTNFKLKGLFVIGLIMIGLVPINAVDELNFNGSNLTEGYESDDSRTTRINNENLKLNNSANNASKIRNIEPDGDITIQEAVDKANPGDTIILDDGQYIGEGNYNINVFKPISIVSKNVGKAIINMTTVSNAVRGFNINSDNVTFDGLAITGVHSSGATIGGAMGKNNGENTLIKQCNFIDNKNIMVAAAILNMEGSASIINCTFSNNINQPFLGEAYGGAIANFADNVYIDGCVFNENSASENYMVGNGGAIYNEGQNVIIKNSNFTKNHAGLNGGAINNNVKPVDANNEIMDCVFIENSAGFGGAVSIENNGGSYVHGSEHVEKCVFKRNTARDGGAVYVRRKASITHNVFENNTATEGIKDHVKYDADDSSPLTVAGLLSYNWWGTNNITDRIMNEIELVYNDYAVVNVTSNMVGGELNLKYNIGLKDYPDFSTGLPYFEGQVYVDDQFNGTFDASQGDQTFRFKKNANVQIIVDNYNFNYTIPLLDDVYVSKDGDDSNWGDSSNDPVASISQGLKLLKENGTIHLISDLNITDVININKNSTIKSDNNSTIKSDGQRKLLNANNKNTIFSTSPGHVINLQDLILKGGNGDSGAIDNNQSDLNIKGCRFEDNIANKYSLINSINNESNNFLNIFNIFDNINIGKVNISESEFVNNKVSNNNSLLNLSGSGHIVLHNRFYNNTNNDLKLNGEVKFNWFGDNTNIQSQANNYYVANITATSSNNLLYTFQLNTGEKSDETVPSFNGEIWINGTLFKTFDASQNNQNFNINPLDDTKIKIDNYTYIHDDNPDSLNDVYVAEWGNDENSGSDSKDPVQNINVAMYIVKSGGTIHILTNLSIHDTIEVTKDVNILGESMGTVVLDGLSQNQIMYINPDLNVNLEYLDFINAFGEDSSAIANDMSNLHIAHCGFHNNVATGIGGAAIGTTEDPGIKSRLWNDLKLNPVMDDFTRIKPAATNSLYKELTISNTTFENNIGAQGSAIFSLSSKLNIFDSTFINNSLDTNTSTIFGACQQFNSTNCSFKYDWDKITKDKMYPALFICQFDPSTSKIREGQFGIFGFFRPSQADIDKVQKKGYCDIYLDNSDKFMRCYIEKNSTTD
jgi:hypothetical protein